jgi:hypothetical protein
MNVLGERNIFSRGRDNTLKSLHTLTDPDALYYLKPKKFDERRDTVYSGALSHALKHGEITEEIRRDFFDAARRYKNASRDRKVVSIRNSLRQGARRGHQMRLRHIIDDRNIPLQNAFVRMTLFAYYSRNPRLFAINDLENVMRAIGDDDVFDRVLFIIVRDYNAEINEFKANARDDDSIYDIEALEQESNQNRLPQFIIKLSERRFLTGPQDNRTSFILNTDTRDLMIFNRSGEIVTFFKFTFTTRIVHEKTFFKRNEGFDRVFNDKWSGRYYDDDDTRNKELARKRLINVIQYYAYLHEHDNTQRNASARIFSNVFGDEKTLIECNYCGGEPGYIDTTYYGFYCNQECLERQFLQ